MSPRLAVQLNPRGFTLVELVIVLAIAALILAGVLLAVGGAQRSQRDTARKSIAGRTATALENYASNNSGGYPQPRGTALAAAYTNGIKDPDTGVAPVTQAAAVATATSGSGVIYVVNATCNGGVSQASTNLKQYAVVYYSESAGASQCIDNK